MEQAAEKIKIKKRKKIRPGAQTKKTHKKTRLTTSQRVPQNKSETGRNSLKKSESEKREREREEEAVLSFHPYFLTNSV